MKLNIEEWKEFKIADVFSQVIIAKSADKGQLEFGNIPFIGRSRDNNGFQGLVNSDIITKGNCITVGMVGTFLPFFQSQDFVASQNILCLYNNHLNLYNSLFICSVMKKLIRNKHFYNRPIQKNKFSNEIIKLPITTDRKPDFKYMENYIKSLYYKKITTIIKKQNLKIDVANWKEFVLEDLFIFVKGKRLTKEDMIEGNVNYLGAISENNGVRQKIDVEKIFLNKENCITVNYNGSVGEAFYQNQPFWASDDVNILYPKNWILNKYIALFICTIIKLDKYRFSYGRKWTLEKMKRSSIKLPISANGSPDYVYMENYIKLLPFSDRI